VEPLVRGQRRLHIRAGAFNGYGTAICACRLPTSASTSGPPHLGTSSSLIDLYGAPQGPPDLFAGFCPSASNGLSDALFLTLDPLGYALPVPQLGGVPFAFRNTAPPSEWSSMVAEAALA
jgi:hypothetical protein